MRSFNNSNKELKDKFVIGLGEIREKKNQLFFPEVKTEFRK